MSRALLSSYPAGALFSVRVYWPAATLFSRNLPSAGSLSSPVQSAAESAAQSATSTADPAGSTGCQVHTEPPRSGPSSVSETLVHATAGSRLLMTPLLVTPSTGTNVPSRAEPLICVKANVPATEA